ncbi:MAG TPA: lysophospholipid acyltransferase family protein [Kofleriaceae bacterium]|nr:lysophospholipid acyltransferase family protein [Kofleriaceae bacterium]
MDPRTFERIAREAPFDDAGHGFDVFGFHPPALASAVSAAAPLYERYFRVDSVGAERIPATGPAILVANHAGVLPVDAAVLCLDVLRRTEPPRVPRAIADHFVPHLPFVGTWFARLGVVSGTRANVSHLLERGELVALWPEGVAGVAKRFRDRYRLAAWRVGFAELAIRHRAPVLPVAVLGAEESWPLARKLDRVRIFGAPYWPIPVVPLPLPAHYHLRYGTVLQLGRSAADADDPHAVAEAAETVRAALQQLVDDSRLARRGVFR